MTITTTDPQLAWVTAPRHLELERFRAYYAAKYPRPATAGKTQERES